MRPWAELLGTLAILELEIWVLVDLDNPLPEGIALAALAGIFMVSYQRLSKDGALLRYTPALPRPAWLEALATTAALGLVIWILGGMLRETYDEVRLDLATGSGLKVAVALGRLVFLVAIQQVGLQLLLVPLCRELIGGRRAAEATAALLFGLLHLPNLLYAAGSGLAGWAWIVMYRRREYLTPLILSHVSLALLASATLPPQTTYGLRAGASGLEQRERYRPYREESVRATLRNVTTDAYFVVHGATLRGYVAGLYQEFLGREGSVAEIDSWLSGSRIPTRPWLARRFVTSGEFRARLVREGNPAREGDAAR